MTRRGYIPLVWFLLAALAQFVPAPPRDETAHAVSPANCMELIQNGGFEDGGLGWQQSSVGGYEIVSDFNPRTGRLGAYLAGVNDADDRLSQTVTLPPAVITLRAWWYLATAETAGAFDRMTISLLRPDGSWLVDLIIVDNTAPVGMWDEIVVDLSAYAGQTLLLRFVGRTDDNNISDFYLDDIGIAACAADPQPSATATAIETPTPTAIATSTATPAGTASPTPEATPTTTPAMTAAATPTLTPRRIYLPYISH
jgi:hypothetical protein